MITVLVSRFQSINMCCVNSVNIYKNKRYFYFMYMYNADVIHTYCIFIYSIFVAYLKNDRFNIELNYCLRKKTILGIMNY